MQAAAQAPYANPNVRSTFEPPKAAEAQSLSESTKRSPAQFLTIGEKSQWKETGRYQDSLALAQALAKASPLLKVVPFGKSAQGRTLYAVIASKERAFTPAQAKATGKPIVLLESCIHPGEVDGKEASEMLLRDIAITRTQAKWLDSMILIFIPIFNVDGHENFSPYHRINQQGPAAAGFRATAQRLNLNRDFMKADAPEMQAWLRFFNAWLPDFFIDNHVTDGADFQYDVTIAAPHQQELWEQVSNWTGQRYLPQLEDGMASLGHIMGPYGGFVERGNPASGFASDTYDPRYSNGYAAIQNRPSLLVETHSLKTFRTRSWAHYDIMKVSLDIIARDPQALTQATKASDAAVAALAGTKQMIHLDGDISRTESKPFTFRGLKSEMYKSAFSGGNIVRYLPETEDIATRLFEVQTTTVAATAPKGYYIPAEWKEVIDRLAWHGIRTERVPAPITQEFQTWRLRQPKWTAAPFEGRLQVSYKIEPTKETRTIPAGSVFVPMNQRAARVALNLLEPGAPDALVRWGFFNSIFEQKEYFSDYLYEPMLESFAKANPELAEAFAARVKSDAAFAGNARARLQWWYERSPWLEKDKEAYPVVRLD